MKQIKCEMCGSADMIKEDSLYVCNCCGMKYSAEEAKKMMVEIEGAVKIDSSEELANLYVLARRANESGNHQDALKYYDMILIKEPASWEAAFYSLLYQSINVKVAAMATSCDKHTHGLPTIISLVKDYSSDINQQKNIIKEITDKIIWIADVFFGNAQKYLKEGTEDQRSVFVASGNILYSFALRLKDSYPGRECIESEIACVKAGLKLQSMRINSYPSDNNDNIRSIYDDWAQFVKEYEPEYVAPKIPELTYDQLKEIEKQKKEEAERVLQEQKEQERQNQLALEKLQFEQKEKELKEQTEKQAKTDKAQKKKNLIIAIIIIAVVVLCFALAPLIFTSLIDLIFGILENIIDKIFGL